MDISKYPLDDSDLSDFEKIFQKLGIQNQFIVEQLNVKSNTTQIVKKKVKKSSTEIPSIHKFEIFKKWIMSKMDEIEEILEKI